ncbi:MAG: sulfite exporter TauE/SafE family protein [Oleibacter sp.]|nr:sulfite exporter TauE/SafE family protein [Thalassolituus sp.]
MTWLSDFTWLSNFTWLPDLTLLDSVILLISSFLGSLLTAALGVGGGAFLIAVMASIVPPLALIPAHGVVQIGSNGARAWLSRSHFNSTIFYAFSLGAILAAVASVFLMGLFDVSWIPIGVALFILWLSWAPVPESTRPRSRGFLFTGGAVTTLATMVFGATGPLVSAWLGRANSDRWSYTANFSACMTLQHVLKIFAFIWLGFEFIEWLPLLGMMIAAGYLGTKVGLKLLGKIPEAVFKQVFRWVLTALAIKLLWNAVS